MEELINGYDDLNVDEVREEIDKRPLSRTNLREIRAYERENKDRVTVTRYIDDLLDDQPDPEAESDVEVDEDDGKETVTVVPQRNGYIAGHFFDYAYTRREVVHDARVEAAIERGDLEVVE